jgi:hypothetical protein
MRNVRLFIPSQDLAQAAVIKTLLKILFIAQDLSHSSRSACSTTCVLHAGLLYGVASTSMSSSVAKAMLRRGRDFINIPCNVSRRNSKVKGIEHYVAYNVRNQRAIVDVGCRINALWLISGIGSTCVMGDNSESSFL